MTALPKVPTPPTRIMAVSNQCAKINMMTSFKTFFMLQLLRIIIMIMIETFNNNSATFVVLKGLAVELHHSSGISILSRWKIRNSTRLGWSRVCIPIAMHQIATIHQMEKKTLFPYPPKLTLKKPSLLVPTNVVPGPIHDPNGPTFPSRIQWPVMVKPIVEKFHKSVIYVGKLPRHSPVPSVP